MSYTRLAAAIPTCCRKSRGSLAQIVRDKIPKHISFAYGSVHLISSKRGVSISQQLVREINEPDVAVNEDDRLVGPQSMVSSSLKDAHSPANKSLTPGDVGRDAMRSTTGGGPSLATYIEG